MRLVKILFVVYLAKGGDTGARRAFPRTLTCLCWQNAPSLLQSLNYLLVSRASHTPWCQGRFQVARALLGWPAGLGPAGSGSEGFPCTPLPSHVTALGCWGWRNCSGGSPSVLLCWHSTVGSISFFVVLPGYLQRAFDQHLSGLPQKPCLLEHRHRCNLSKTCL